MHLYITRLTKTNNSGNETEPTELRLKEQLAPWCFENKHKKENASTGMTGTHWLRRACHLSMAVLVARKSALPTPSKMHYRGGS